MIKHVNPGSLHEVYTIYNTCRAELLARGIAQWTPDYPSLELVAADISKKYLFGYKKNDENYQAVIHLSKETDSEHDHIAWTTSDNALYVRRLAVSPAAQHQGIGLHLMDFANTLALQSHCETLRLDVFKGNPRLHPFYYNLGYAHCGSVWYGAESREYYCFEKVGKS